MSLIDPRWDQLADILVHYSTQVESGDKVLITMREVDTLPLLCAVYQRCVMAGAHTYVEFQSARLESMLMMHGSKGQLAHVPRPQSFAMEWANKYIGLRGAQNPHEFTQITPHKVALHKQAQGAVSALRTESTRWVLVRVPSEVLAQQAGMSLDDMMAFFFDAALRDWEAESKYCHELKEVFESGTEVRITGRETDMRFSTMGRGYIAEDGRINMPGGEIFTAPVDHSPEGHIYFEHPVVYAGQLLHGVRLEFSQGRLVSATAETNQALLEQVIQMDEGASRIGEFGVGTNAGVDRFSSEVLYDEKIKGTVHIALGRAYAECGGVNQSALHWDMVKDLVQQGEIYLDDRLIYTRGEFLTERS